MEPRSHTTTDTLEQGEEEILIASMSDETLEAAAAKERGGNTSPIPATTISCC